jgi:hypothetical protein
VPASGTYTCTCSPGYSGANCNIQVCTLTCQNGGNCVFNNGVQQCNCPINYGGTNCQICKTLIILLKQNKILSLINHFCCFYIR